MPDSPVCRWWMEGDTDTTAYDTSCRETFEFYDGGPTENKFRHCPYCGRPLQDDGIISDEEGASDA